MSTSPAVGSSRPAIVRSRVVLPQPDGPSRTRYSPSPPPQNSLGGGAPPPAPPPPPPPAADHPPRPPLVEDRSDLRLRVGHRLLRGDLTPSGTGEHVGDDEGREHLALG